MPFLSTQSRPVITPPRGIARLWRRMGLSSHWPALVAVAVLSAIGIVSIWQDKNLTTGASEGPKQLVFLGVAVLCMTAFQAVNYQKIGRYSWGFYIFSLLLIGYTVVGAQISHGGAKKYPLPGITYTNGACAWITFGPVEHPWIGIQPAELMKIAFIMVLARYLRFRSNYRTLWGLLPPFAVAGVPLLFIMKQPDLGTALTFIPALFAMLFVAGAKKSHLLAIVLLSLIAAPILWMSGEHVIESGPSAGQLCPTCPHVPVLRHLPQFVKHYQRARVLALLGGNSPELRDVAIQQDAAVAAMGYGGITGQGIGNLQMSRHVPERHNDMIFAVIGEQFGFIGTLVVLIAYTVLFATGIEIASSTREPFGRLVALGIVAILAGQTFLNLMVAVRLMPVTGVTLPFISYGGSSLLASFMAAGILLNIGQNRPIVMANNAFEFEDE